MKVAAIFISHKDVSVFIKSEINAGRVSKAFFCTLVFVFNDYRPRVYNCVRFCTDASIFCPLNLSVAIL